MAGLIEKPAWISVKDMVMVPAGSIGAELIAGISDLGERQRPDTTFNQPFVRLPSFSRQHPDLVSYGDILRRPAEELDKFAPGFRLRERLTDYLEDQLILPHSRLLEAIYDRPQFPAPADREQEIVKGVEDVLNQMQSTRRRTVLIQRFGLYDGITRSLEETGKYLRSEKPVFRQEVSNTETRGLRYLRRPAIARLMREFFMLPEASFGREVFGAVLEKDLPELDGRASTEALHLPSDVVAALEVNRIPLIEYFNYPFRRIEDLVSKDLSTFDETPVFSWVKQEIALALQRRVVEVANKARREAKQKALDEVWRRARIGEPVNNLMPGFELTQEQRESLDQMPLQEVGFSTRSYNALGRTGMRSVGELLRLTEEKLLAVSNIGVKTVVEVLDKLTTFLKSQ